jgi:methionyl-tRNA synthetase
MEQISFEEWKKVDLRIAKIIDVKDHPNADKLYVIKVSLGNEERTIVAGIKPWYKKEELIGKKIVIVANLQPKNLRGIESRGMLLAAENGNNVVLLTVDKDIKEGSKVF